jgi:phosphoribosylformylglycinamidine synthase
MKFIAHINIMPQAALLDPQGKAVTLGLVNLGLSQINNVRVGKHITLELEAENFEIAQTIVNDACSKLLANPIMENFEFSLSEII